MGLEKNYYLGLDIGTNSVGYAVTDESYNLLKFNGKEAWGVHLFDEANLSAERRSFRNARRRLDRRQQRVHLVQELFYDEIQKIDQNFFKRLQESSLFRDETNDDFILFNDSNYTDKEYYSQYPTIHHLIVDLMNNPSYHDVRLVYLACAWLVTHRGHFLNNIDKDNLSNIRQFDSVYKEFICFFTNNGLAKPWDIDDPTLIGEVLKEKTGVNQKQKDLCKLLFDGKKPPKEPREDFPYNTDAIVKLLAGGTCKIKDLFSKDEYNEAGSISLKMDDDKFAEIISIIGDDFNLIEVMRAIMDWSVLIETLGDSKTISEAKVNIYNQHKEDLHNLKFIINKYAKEKYDEVFRKEQNNNYSAYSKGSKKEDFYKYISNILVKIIESTDLDSNDFKLIEIIQSKIALSTFLPKQKDTSNRVIPHQLYWFELNEILKNAKTYLPFLNKKDDSNLTTAEKILSVFLFRIPYFVGPLNNHSPYAWIERKKGKIYPWNFEHMVDLDMCEQNFIEKMTNFCTYLPGESVLPKNSILYQKFMILNEINNLKVNGEKISVDTKQSIFKNLFATTKKVTRKKLSDYLICNGFLEKGSEDALTGIDTDIKASFSSYIAFKKMLSNKKISLDDAERIIERSAYAEDKSRLSTWLKQNYISISDEDRKYICSLKIKDFGRLSKYFLSQLEGVCKSTGEVKTIIDALWDTNLNLMELINSQDYTFKDSINSFREEYYSVHPLTLEERMNEMYLSSAVKRSVYRTLDIVKDIKKAFGNPQKIFVETTRSNDQSLKGKRSISRKQQILDLYQKCSSEDIPALRTELEKMGETADNRLRSDKLFLYYMQLGKSLYSGKTIELAQLGTETYDIDHIYPQAYVKDDSIINNKVLVLSEENSSKSDTYPLSPEIQKNMQPFWRYLKDVGLISAEKDKRLTRTTGFSAEEKTGFIARQLTETSQSTKAVVNILSEQFPKAEIFYSKASIVSEFRNKFDCLKSRSFNDLHHASDAFLNIVVGNVYHMKFTKKWFSIDSKYSIKTKTIFTHKLECDKKTIWDPQTMLERVIKTTNKNTANFTKYSFYKKGGLFDQQPIKASTDLIPLKKDLPTEKYGGYNKAAVMFFIPVKYKAGKKEEIIIMPVELLYGKQFLKDSCFAKKYTFKRLQSILGKTIESTELPFGNRPWKVNTVLSLDGFRICIAGSSNRGKSLIAQPIMQFSESYYWKKYIKRLEGFEKKLSVNPSFSPDPIYDKITSADSLKLYDIYINKLENSIYSKRINSPLNILKQGRNKFEMLNEKEQAIVLLNIHSIFGRMSSGCDLTSIDASKHTAATVNFSSTISNWRKYYKDVRIIDSSASGLWEKQSDNLLELL